MFEPSRSLILVGLSEAQYPVLPLPVLLHHSLTTLGLTQFQVRILALDFHEIGHELLKFRIVSFVMPTTTTILPSITICSTTLQSLFLPFYRVKSLAIFLHCLCSAYHSHELCRRIAKSTGATIVSTLADLDGNESFDVSALGTADEVKCSCLGHTEESSPLTP